MMRLPLSQTSRHTCHTSSDIVPHITTCRGPHTMGHHTRPQTSTPWVHHESQTLAPQVTMHLSLAPWVTTHFENPCHASHSLGPHAHVSPVPTVSSEGSRCCAHGCSQIRVSCPLSRDEPARPSSENANLCTSSSVSTDRLIDRCLCPSLHHRSQSPVI